MIKNVVFNEEVFKKMLDDLVLSSNIDTKEKLITLRNCTLEYMLDYFNNNLTPIDNSPLDFISCDEVTVEIKDKTTSKIFRRDLDISYIENSNGLKLIGENIHGKKSEIVFFSDTAIGKISDVIGMGPDKSRCHD